MTMQPIERAPGTSLEAQMHYAQVLADSNLLPAAYRKSPANVLLAAQLGEALGIPTIQAINSIHVIEGRPSAGADLIASIVRRAGHRLRVVEQTSADGPVVVATLIRADDPDFSFTARWDMGKARQAGLAGKENWKKYPGQMMRNRAVMEVCRQGASDAMYGVNYDPEELEGMTGSGSGAGFQSTDWWAETDAATSIDVLTALWTAAHREKQLDEPLQQHMRARRRQLEADAKTAAAAVEIVDADVVEVIDEVTGVVTVEPGVVGGEAAVGGPTTPTREPNAAPPAPHPARKATITALVRELDRCGVMPAQAEAYLPLLGATVDSMGELDQDQAIALLEFARSLDREKLAGMIAAAAQAGAGS